MSRVGKLPVIVPSGVKVQIDNGGVTVNGHKGQLSQFAMPGITVKQEGDKLLVERANDEQMTRARHGLMRTLISNIITGVSEGFSKKLEIHGVGYRVNMSGADLNFNLGYSHDLTYKIPQGVTASLEQNVITISGISKQQVGQIAAEIRALRKPEPYKGKGIRYSGERIIRKSGKSGKEKA